MHSKELETQEYLLLPPSDPIDSQQQYQQNNPLDASTTQLDHAATKKQPTLEYQKHICNPGTASCTNS